MLVVLGVTVRLCTLRFDPFPPQCLLPVALIEGVLITLAVHTDLTRTEIPYAGVRHCFIHFLLLFCLGVLYLNEAGGWVELLTGPDWTIYHRGAGPLSRRIKNPREWVMMLFNPNEPEGPMLCFCALMLLPVFWGCIFAPLLIAFAGDNVFSALFKSWIAGLRNFVALLVPFVALLAAFMCAIIAMVLFGLFCETYGKQILGVVGMDLLHLFIFTMFLFAFRYGTPPLLYLYFLLVLMPYFAAREIFYIDSPSADDA